LSNVFAKIFGQIVCIRVKKHGKTNVVTSRHIKQQKALLLVEVHRSRTSLLRKCTVYGVFIKSKSASANQRGKGA